MIAHPTPPEALPALGWRSRARLVAADLLAFDASRLAYVLAARTLVGLFVPLLLARALHMPSLIWVGIGAYLLAIGDCLDDGDRHQPLRLAVGSLLGGLALATGVLAGANLPLAMAGMLAWGMITGMMGVYDNAYAIMSLPIAWAYVELGLPVDDHSLAHALYLGALFAAGGAFMLLLTFTLRLGGPHAPVRTKAATCYRAVADYLGTVSGVAPVSPETRVRSAITEARRVAGQMRGALQAPGAASRKILVLIEIADRLFSLGAAMKEEGAAAPALFLEAMRTIGAALQGRPDEAALRALAEKLDPHRVDAPPAPSPGEEMLEWRMGRELSRAVHILLGTEAPAPLPTAPAPATNWLDPLLENLHWNSVVARHALRFAVVASLAVAIFWVFPKPFGYWVPLTVTVVLKPYAGMTLMRTIQRIVGTTAGILLGMALMPFLPAPALQLALVAVAFFWMMAALPFNYSLAIFFLSAGLIPYEHMLNPGLTLDVGLMRLVATGIGALLALVGGHLLWPTFERRALPALLNASLTSMAAYAGLALDAAGHGDSAAAEVARRQAGRDTTNLQASLEHAMTEVGGDPAALTGLLRAAAALQQMLNTLNALMAAAPALAQAPEDLAPFRAAFTAGLSSLAADAPHAAAKISSTGPSPSSGFLARTLERLSSEFRMLSDALSASDADLTPPAGGGSKECVKSF
ncbi:FUSC family protein [Roseixanthobacter pseudopolyaromaticivorans]|uniref:FUSC family protein n=1 Tax=Xanthobacteraceae TaxID=335928 RepID=UPI00372AB428